MAFSPLVSFPWSAGTVVRAVNVGIDLGQPRLRVGHAVLSSLRSGVMCELGSIHHGMQAIPVEWGMTDVTEHPDGPVGETGQGDRANGAGGDALRLAEIYSELRRIARREHRRNPQLTLNTTAVVHEAWLKLSDRDGEFKNREHFIGTAAMAMRQVLVDYARYRTAAKRDVGQEVRLFENEEIEGGTAAELLAIDQALEGLEALDPRLAQLVSLRFFAGLSLDEAANHLGISARTAARDWGKARAYLQTVLTP